MRKRGKFVSDELPMLPLYKQQLVIDELPMLPLYKQHVVSNELSKPGKEGKIFTKLIHELHARSENFT